jgi:hypothetical protein
LCFRAGSCLGRPRALRTALCIYPAGRSGIARLRFAVIVAWCMYQVDLCVLICLLASRAPGFASDTAYHTVALIKAGMLSPSLLLLLLALAGAALTCRAQATATRCFSVNVDTLHTAFNYQATLLSFAGCDPASIKCALMWAQELTQHPSWRCCSYFFFNRSAPAEHSVPK